MTLDTIENYLEHYRKEQAGSAFAEIASIFNRLSDEQMKEVLERLQRDYRVKRIERGDSASQQEVLAQKREHQMQLQEMCDWWSKRRVGSWLEDCFEGDFND